MRAIAATLRVFSANWFRSLLEPVDAAWLAAFRILLGIALAVSMLRFELYGWVDRFFVEPRFFFKYWGFEWVEPLSAQGMHALFWTLIGLALAVALGLAFRISASLLALGLTYFQLIDVSTYLNHYYLAALLAWFLAVSPANRLWSVDDWIARKWRTRASSHQFVSRGWLSLLRVQVGVVYVFAGLAKAQSDWLIHGQPLRIWLGANVDLPWIGPLFALEWVPLAMSWAGFLYDATIVFWLLHPRTRPWAFLVLIVFHSLTRLLFPIGMFPVIMTLSALVFFSPSWPRRLLARLGYRAAPTGASVATAAKPLRITQKLLLTAGILHCLVQVGLPLRHHLYGGNVLWHEQGMRFSWRVMVRAKGGEITFVVRNTRTNQSFHLSPRAYLTGMQESEMSSQPDLILQLARHIKHDLQAQGYGPLEVRAEARVALNGRRSAQLIDPNLDLSEIEDGLESASWILPAPSNPPPHTRPIL